MIQQELLKHLQQFVTEDKLQRIDDVIKNRTRHLSVILEDIYQPHNASAVLRSCECFGIQDLHVIEQEKQYRPNPEIALGSSQWLTIHRYKETQACLKQLKKKGYQIAALTLEENSRPIETLDIHQKTALCFGTEDSGLSKITYDLADHHVTIPMFGFTQSFNISVSAALSLYILRNKLKLSNINWQLSDEEKTEVIIDWLTNMIAAGDNIKQQFLKKHHE